MTVFRHAKVSPAPTPGDTYGFPFCQRLWALTKRRDDIVVADMVADKVAELEMDIVADMEVTQSYNFDQKSQFWPNFPILT